MSNFHHRAPFLEPFHLIPILTVFILPLAMSIMAKMAILAKNSYFGHNGHDQWQHGHGQYGYHMKEFQKCSSVVKIRHPYDLYIKSYGHFTDFHDFRLILG